MEDTSSQSLLGPRLQLNEQVLDTHIKSPKIQQVEHLENSTWIVLEAFVCDKPVTKKNLSEEDVRSKFLEHDVML